MLVSLGHDQTPEVTDYIYSNAGNNQGISINTDGQCPLHIAAFLHHVDMIEFLCTQFPKTIERRDKSGRTPLLVAAGAQMTSTSSPQPRNGAIPGRKNTLQSTEDVRAIETLLRFGADVRTQALNGDTCLHQACAWGNLKTARALVQAGADPLRTNNAGWRPDAYSLSVQADVYFRNLVAEFEKRRAEDAARKRNERRPPNNGGGAVRLVDNKDEDDEDDDDDDDDDESDISDATDEKRRILIDRKHSIAELSNESANGLGIKVESRAETWR